MSAHKHRMHDGAESKLDQNALVEGVVSLEQKAVRDIVRRVMEENRSMLEQATREGWSAIPLKQAEMDLVGGRAALAWSSYAVSGWSKYLEAQAALEGLDQLIEQDLISHAHLLEGGQPLENERDRKREVTWDDVGRTSWTKS